MDERRKEIINLCFNLFDGDSKSEIKKHNKSALKLLDIFNEVKEDKKYAQLLYSALLKHEDDKVKYEAACCCLTLKVYTWKAKTILRKIKRRNPNTSLGVSASLVLDKYKILL